MTPLEDIFVTFYKTIMFFQQILVKVKNLYYEDYQVMNQEIKINPQRLPQ